MKTKRGRFFAFFALFCACSFLTKDTRITICCPQKGPMLEVVTVNAGLAPGLVPYATPRVKPFANEIAKYRGAGILCMQEVWREDHAREIIKSLNLPLENVFHVDTRSVEEEKGVAFCTEKELKSTIACVMHECGVAPGEDFTNCAMARCFTNLATLYLSTRRCALCLIASVGQPLDMIVDTCVNQGGVTRVYNGSNGVILASRWPLRDRVYIELPSSGANRVALFARVEIAGQEPLEVACTHISSPNSVPPAHSKFSNWGQEMEAQVDIIAGLLFARAGSRPALLVGDMNAGPTPGFGVSGISEAVWSMLKRLGFTSPATEIFPPFCTMCSDNNLRNSSHANRSSGNRLRNHIIDHILVHDPPGGTALEPVCAHPMLDQPEWILDYNGNPIYTNLSDHYGLVVKFFLHRQQGEK